jgi:hypothetical protein
VHLDRQTPHRTRRGDKTFPPGPYDPEIGLVEEVRGFERVKKSNR